MPGVVGSPSPVCQMPPPPFWNQGVARIGSAFDVWKPQMPLLNRQVPPVPQSAVAKHSLPGVGPPEQTPPPLYSHTGLGLTPVGLLNTERSGNQPPSLLSKFQGTSLPHFPPAPQSASVLQPAPGVGPPTQPVRMPLSRRPFGMMSFSPWSSTPSPSRSSPRVLAILPFAVPTTNRLEKVTSSSGKKIPLNGSILSGVSI